MISINFISKIKIKLFSNTNLKLSLCKKLTKWEKYAEDDIIQKFIENLEDVNIYKIIYTLLIIM
jgi:hypothetical protein